jgi:hypothetical protein
MNEPLNIADIRARLAALDEWMASQKRNWYDPAELPADINPPTNEERADLEVYEWLTNPPLRYFAYVDDVVVGQPVINWTGRQLGHVTWCGHMWRDNFGTRRVNFRMVGTNGVSYAGTAYPDSGTYCRLRATK